MSDGNAINWAQDVVGLLRSQKWVMGLTALAIALGATVIAFRWPPTYQATASILMQGPGSRGILSGTGGRGEAMSKEDLSSELEILRSPDLLKITVQAVHESEAPGVEDIAAGPAETVDTTRPRRVTLPVDMAMLLRQLEEASSPTDPDDPISTPSYNCWATRMVRLAANPNRLDAACCRVDVINGGEGLDNDSLV